MLPWFIKYPYQNDQILNLDWLLKELQDFRTSFESWAETIAALQEALEDINDWENRIEALETISAQIPEIKKSLDNLYNLHEADTKNLKALIDDLQNQINALDIAALRAYVDSRDNELMLDYNRKIYENYVLTYSLFDALKSRVEILANIIASIDTKAFNPWPRSLSKESLQDNLKFAYSDLADSVPDASEYAELGLTASEYVNYDLLARDYSLRGFKALKMDFVYSPVFGFKQELNNVLTSIVNFMKGTLNADEYTALDLDAESYTALDLTALDYYSYASTASGIVGTGGTGLTSEQYSSLQIL